MPRVGISEHTERPEFIDSLKQKLGVQFRVFQELILDSKSKDRHSLQEDIIIFDAASVSVDLEDRTISWNSDEDVVAVIETKTKGESLQNAEEQLTKYVKEFRCTLGFLTNYRDIIGYKYSVDFEIKETSVYGSDDIEKVTDYIARFIEENTRISIQKTPDQIIRILEDSIDDLMKYTSEVEGETWESVLRLSDEPERIAKKDDLTEKERQKREVFFQRSASYVVISQILFYVAFRQYRIYHNINIRPRLRPLSSSNGIPTQIQEILLDVPNNDLNFKAIFGKSKGVLSQLGDEASVVLRRIIHVLEGISARFVIENDLLGQIFQRLMPYDTRKNYAAFYTLPKAAELICRLAIKDKNTTVYDPACGSGTLLVFAYSRKRALGLNQHKQLLEQIRGSDISDIATMMSTVNLAIQNPSKWTDHVNIYPHDAFSLISGITRFFASSQETPDGRISVSPIFPPDKDYRVDVLLANPPFTRGSRLTKGQRQVLRNLEMVQKYKFRPNFKSINLYAFFMLIAPQLVKKEDGIIAFILPQGAINSEIMIGVADSISRGVWSQTADRSLRHR